MVQKFQIKTKSRISSTSSATIQTVLEELRLLRNEILLLLPQEGLKEYAHPDRIHRSYQKALKKYPLHASWK